MQAAFIDVGQERSAFLHVEDLIRPDDFELYLAGGSEEDNESFRGTGERKAARTRDEDDDDDDDEDDDDGPSSLNGAADSRRDAPVDSRALGESFAAGTASDEEDDEDDDDDELDDVGDDGGEDVGHGPADRELDDDEPEDSDADEADDADDEPEDDDADEVGGPSDAPLSIDSVDVDEDDEDADDEPLAAHASSDTLQADSGLVGDVIVSEVTVSEVAVSYGIQTEGTTQAVVETQRRTRVRAEVVEGSTSEVPATDRGGSREGRGREGGRGEGRERNRSGREGSAREGNAREGSAREGNAREGSAARSDSPRSDGGEGRGRNRRGRGSRDSRGRRGRQRNECGGGGGGGGDAKLVRGRRSARAKSGAARLEASVPPRVTRSVPITEVVKEGDVVVVQISKEPIGTKGARVTSHVSLPGRYVVYLPTVDHLGISKRIGSSRERQRLRQVMDSLKPARGGLIVRTVAEGLTKKQLKADVGYLIRVWAEVCKKRETAKAADTLYTELDLVLKVARDLFTDEVKTIVIDDREQYNRLVRFVEMFLPERVKDIELYTGSEPIFDAYGIEDEIGRALSRKVPLPSGGSLIVDQAEALTAIDVNTGRYVGKGSKDLEETALKTNLEAVEEIAYQLRFRNIGGLVILDLIDMEKYANREKVWRALEAALVKDKAKTTLNRISELGLIEMTRKRTRESLGRMLHEPCFYCDGTGQIQSKATIAYEILRQIGRERHSLPGYSVVVNAHPAIVDFLKTVDRSALDEAERRYARRIELNQRSEYHIEQYDLQGK
ncbi:MAG TPA: Rne/Rng family ribonuclease [Polyangiaceae bacterium]|nr:Rne/Rng family ribonuclease [Polyangiaceae bacterium]